MPLDVVSPHCARASAALALVRIVLVTVFKLSLLLIARSVFDMCSLDALANLAPSLSLSSTGNLLAVLLTPAAFLCGIAGQSLNVFVHRPLLYILSAIDHSIPLPPVQYCVLGTGIRCGSMQHTLVDHGIQLLLSLVEDASSFATSLIKGPWVAYSAPTVDLLLYSCAACIYLCSLWYLFSSPLSFEKPLDAQDLSLMVEVHRKLFLIFSIIYHFIGWLRRRLLSALAVVSAALALVSGFQFSPSGWPLTTTHRTGCIALALNKSALIWYTLFGLVTLGVVGLFSYTALIVYIVLRAHCTRKASVAHADVCKHVSLGFNTKFLPNTLDTPVHKNEAPPEVSAAPPEDDKRLAPPSVVTFNSGDSSHGYHSCTDNDGALSTQPTQGCTDLQQLQASVADSTPEQVYLTAPVHHTNVTYEFSGAFQRDVQIVQASTISPRFAESYHVHSGFLAKYELGEEIGAGGNAFVMQARRRSDGQDVAVKFVSQCTDSPCNRRPWVNHAVYGRIPQEVGIMHSADHDNVIKLLDVFKDDSWVYIVQELHGKIWYPIGQLRNNRSLAAYLLRKGRMSVTDARYVFAQVVEAVAYLDNGGIAHGDLKAENIVLDAQLRVKLIDFGGSTRVDWQQPSSSRPFYDSPYSYCGTRVHTPPEIYLKQPYQSAPTDIWTLGTLLYQMITGRRPFLLDVEMIKLGAIEYKEEDIQDWDGLIEVWSIIQCCLQVDPEKRWTVRKLRGHPQLCNIEI